MRNIWKGAISFGLVSIPIKLYTATESKDLKFRFLHKKCNHPVQYEKVCPVCEDELSSEDIVKGYEYEKGKFVIVEEYDFEKLPLNTLKAIEIVDFIDMEEIDPVFYVKSYFLAPAELGVKPYFLLMEAMKQTKKIALARVVIRSKETLAVLRIYKNTLMLETIFYPDEIRNPEALPEFQNSVQLNKNELKMAINLVESLSTKFEPEKYSNQYKEALMALIQAKITGKEVAVPPSPEGAKVVDLMEALKASLEAAKKAQKEKKPSSSKKGRQTKVTKREIG